MKTFSQPTFIGVDKKQDFAYAKFPLMNGMDFTDLVREIGWTLTTISNYDEYKGQIILIKQEETLIPGYRVYSNSNENAIIRQCDEWLYITCSSHLLIEPLKEYTFIKLIDEMKKKNIKVLLPPEN